MQTSTTWLSSQQGALALRAYLDKFIPHRLLAILLLIHKVQGQACQLAQLISSQQLRKRLQHPANSAACPEAACPSRSAEACHIRVVGLAVAYIILKYSVQCNNQVLWNPQSQITCSRRALRLGTPCPKLLTADRQPGFLVHIRVPTRPRAY